MLGGGQRPEPSPLTSTLASRSTDNGLSWGATLRVTSDARQSYVPTCAN